MRKLLKTLIGATMFVMIATPAWADQVFQHQEGSWSIRGYYDFKNGANSCEVGTQWDNGSHVKIIVVPVSGSNGQNDVKMEVRSMGTNWVAAGLKVGSTFIDQISFGYTNGEVKILKALPTVEALDILVVENLTAEFEANFKGAKEMILFPGSPGELYVNLNGSYAMSVALTNCLYEISDEDTQETE